MNNKETIAALTCGFLDISDIEPYINNILEALEKQIPKKPLNTKDKAGICPTCGNYICFAWHETACGDCGQAIDWSEVK